MDFGRSAMWATAMIWSSVAAMAAPAGTSPTLAWEVPPPSIVYRELPRWPDGELGGATTCQAAVRVDPNGAPSDVAVEGCPQRFASAAHTALRAWRWAPWASMAERRITLTVRFVPPHATPTLVPAATEPRPATQAPVAPQALAQVETVAPQTTPTTSIVCSGAILRNRQGGSRRIDVGACPTAFQDAMREAMKEIARQPARSVRRPEPAKRVQPVQVRFEVADI